MHRSSLPLAVLVGLACFFTRSLADPRYTVVDDPVYLFMDNDKHGDTRCTIDIHLWVAGPKRENCIRKLAQASHVARFEEWARRRK